VTSFVCSVCHLPHSGMPMGYRVVFPVKNYPDGAVTFERDGELARAAEDRFILANIELPVKGQPSDLHAALGPWARGARRRTFAAGGRRSARRERHLRGLYGSIPRKDRCRPGVVGGDDDRTVRWTGPHRGGLRPRRRHATIVFADLRPRRCVTRVTAAFRYA
jgi:hypothetical protein